MFTGNRDMGKAMDSIVETPVHGEITFDLQEVGCGYMDWIGLAQDRDRWRTLVSAGVP